MTVYDCPYKVTVIDYYFDMSTRELWRRYRHLWRFIGHHHARSDGERDFLLERLEAMGDSLRARRDGTPTEPFDGEEEA